MLAKNLKRLRKEKKLTLEEIASALGTSKQTIHRYENGIISNIPPEKVRTLAALLEVTPAHLMGWESDDNLSSVNGVMPISIKKLPLLGEILRFPCHPA